MISSQTDISPWLEDTPDLKNVEDVRTTIANLRLRLRQRLADKKDLEQVDLKYTKSTKIRKLFGGGYSHFTLPF